jgi:hypothetical protein
MDWLSVKDAILKDAILWSKRTVQSGMSIYEVDVFTILMGKTIEHCTKGGIGGMSLAEALKEMSGFASMVMAHGKPEKRRMERSKQLTLWE